MASTSSRRRRKRLLLLGGVFALIAGLLIKREQVAGLLPSRSSGGSSPTPAPAPPPTPSNYDAPGPPANTATPVPVPEAQQPAAIDEAAEEAAAAAEAANIGGSVSDYAGPLGERADDAMRPLYEAGQGESEGQEQTEAELAAAAEPTAPGMSPEQHQIEDAIEAVDDAGAGERVEPLAPLESDSRDETADRPGDRPAPFGGPGAETPGAPVTGAEATPPVTGDEEAAGSASPALWADRPPAAETPAVPPTEPAQAVEQPTEPFPPATPEPPAADEPASPPAAATPEPPAADEPAPPPAPAQPAVPPPPPEPASSPTWGPGGWSPPKPSGDDPAEPDDKPAEASKPQDEDDGGGWQTWSGRSVSP